MKRTRLAIGSVLVLIFQAGILAQAPQAHRISSPGGHWSVQVPLDWNSNVQDPDERFVESVRLLGTGETKAYVTIQVYRTNPDFEVMKSDLKRSFAKNNVNLENESVPTIHGKTAFRFEILQTSAKKPLRLKYAVVDAGSRKVLVISALPELPPPSDDPEVKASIAKLVQTERAFEDLIASMDVPEPPGPPVPLELEARDFAEDGLKIETPAAGSIQRGESGFSCRRDDLGFSFDATWQRTRLSPADLASFDMEESMKAETAAVKMTLVEKKEIQVGGKPAVRVRAYGMAGPLRVHTVTAAYVATGADEVLTLTFTRIGEQKFEDLAALEQALERAQASSRYAAALSAAPALTVKTEVWQGIASAMLPEGWAGAPVPLANGVIDSRRWSAAKAADLGASFDVMPSGKLEFEGWLHDRKVPARFGATLSKPRTVNMGGVTGSAWDLEYGPTSDRWSINVVAVFARGRGYSITTQCPVRLKDVYGGLAEKIAATVNWK